MCNMCTRDVSAIEPPEVEKAAEITQRALDKFKEKHNIVTDPDNEEIQREVAYQPDLLAVSTQYTKVIADYFVHLWKEMKQTQAYTIATRFSQPFHVAVGLIVLVYWLNTPGTATNVRIWKALYVAAVATHLGSQIWMTLISGVVLYFNLPRHEFGRVQTVLFPVYYLFNAIVSLLAVVAYFRTQCLLKFEHISWIQFLLLLAVFSIEAGVRLSLVKPMLRAKHIKTQMEEAAGGGQEVGKLVLGELAHCPRYMRVLKTFRTYHSSIATGTMIALGCSIYSTMIIVDSMCY